MIDRLLLLKVGRVLSGAGIVAPHHLLRLQCLVLLLLRLLVSHASRDSLFHLFFGYLGFALLLSLLPQLIDEGLAPADERLVEALHVTWLFFVVDEREAEIDANDGNAKAEENEENDLHKRAHRFLGIFLSLQ